MMLGNSCTHPSPSHPHHARAPPHLPAVISSLQPFQLPAALRGVHPLLPWHIWWRSALCAVHGQMDEQ
jgi:hypothetical protein